METLMQPQRLRERIMTWCKGEMAKGTLAKGADVVMREALLSGEVERGALPSLLGVSDRQARKVTAELLAVGALKSNTQRAPLRLSFPARLASDWMPGRSVTFRISRITDGFILWARLARVQVMLVLLRWGRKRRPK